MTAKELREHPEYQRCIDKITNYRKGFTFTIHFTAIPVKKANALRVILRDCCKMGLIESTSIGLSLGCEITDESYIRL